MKTRNIIIAVVCLAIVLALGTSYTVWSSDAKASEDKSGIEITSSIDDTDKDKADKKEEKKEKKEKKDSASSKPAASAEKKSSSSSTPESKKLSSGSSSSKDSGSSSAKPAATHTHTKATRTHTETETKYRNEEIWHSEQECGCGFKTESTSAWSSHCKSCSGYRSRVNEWCEVVKKPYTVTHTITEVYCTSCGKVLSTSRS